MLLPDYVVIAVHQKVYKLSILLIYTMSKVTRHEITIKSLSVSALSLLPSLPLFVNSPTSIVRRAISGLLKCFIIAVSICVAPWTT